MIVFSQEEFDGVYIDGVDVGSAAKKDDHCCWICGRRGKTRRLLLVLNDLIDCNDVPRCLLMMVMLVNVPVDALDM